MRFSRYCLILLIPVAVCGCGPGFPILTGEQEALMTNVERLMKDNASLKARVAALEGTGPTEGGIAELKKELEGLKKSMAEANSSLEETRREISFLQGSAEEAEHKKEQLRASVKSIDASFKSVESRLASVEGSLKDANSRIEALKASSEAGDKKLAELRQYISDNESRAAEPAEKKGRKPAPEEVYLKGYRETVDKDYARAAETFHGFIIEYPEHKFAGNAQYWIGEIYYARGDWERAIIEFDKVIKKYPKAEKVPASLLKQGFSFEKLGSRKEAQVLLKEVIEKYPGSPEAGIAKKRLERR